MLRFIVHRLLRLVPVLAAAVVLAFIATNALPGDPVSVMLSDHSADVEMAARLRHDYGLDQPLWRQFVTYVEGLARGDFGLSYRYVRQPVTAVIRDSLAISPLLAMASLFVALPLGALGGIQAAIRRNSLADT